MQRKVSAGQYPYAAYAAKRMGLPIERLIVGTNSNDILARFFATAEMRKAAVVPTYSPSMDIQVSSNFERLLFELLGRDGGLVETKLAEFQATGAFGVSPEIFAEVTGLFSGTHDATIDGWINDLATSSNQSARQKIMAVDVGPEWMVSRWRLKRGVRDFVIGISCDVCTEERQKKIRCCEAKYD